MVKKELIGIRIDSETKRRLEAAARMKGQSLTTFILNATEKAMLQVEKQPEKSKGTHTGVPTFFRACCWEASRGGQFGYEHPAYQLVGGLRSQIPYDVDDDEWEAEIEKLDAIVRPVLKSRIGKGERIGTDRDDVDDAAVIEWFTEHYPKCMAMVPKRRHAAFVSGVHRAFLDEVLD